MKGFQENLLVVVALGLCGLCIYQWRGQTIQRNQIEILNQTVNDKSAAIQSYTNSIKVMDQQIAALGAQIADVLRLILVKNDGNFLQPTYDVPIIILAEPPTPTAVPN